MTTRRELQKWLNRFPPDTIIEFAIQEEAPLYESYGDVGFKSPELTNEDEGIGWELLDFTNNEFVKQDTDIYGKRFLRLGERY